MHNLREIDSIGHAFVLEKDKVLRQVLETIADCEQQMINKKKKQNDINSVRKLLRNQETQTEVFRVQS
jgi:hypothetical protein